MIRGGGRPVDNDQRRWAGSCHVSVSTYLVSFMGSCVIAACYACIMFYTDTWLYIDLLVTMETNYHNRHNFQYPSD